MTPLKGIPYHGPIRDGDESFGEVARIGVEGVEAFAGPAEDDGLEAGGRRCGVRHCFFLGFFWCSVMLSGCYASSLNN